MMMDSPSQPGSLAHAGKTRNTGKVAINRVRSIAFEAPPRLDKPVLKPQTKRL